MPTLRDFSLSPISLGCAVAAVLIGFAGCTGGSNPPEPASPTPEQARESSVPLRVASTATAEFNARLEQAWSSVSEQPLEITSADAETLAAEAEQSDVVLFHNLHMGQLQAADLLTPLPESFLDSPGVDRGSLLPGLLHGGMQWADTIFALPLGIPLPAVWIASDAEVPERMTWQDYGQLVASAPRGEAAEPLAEGWAAHAFLQRAATLSGAGWLFDRNTLQPVITDPPYVRALEQLVAARQSYPEALLTPEQVWQQLRSGELRIAIAWPAGGEGTAAAAAGTAMLPYPIGEEVFIDRWQEAPPSPLPPVASANGLMLSIARSCRQTAAARALLTWLVSPEGHASVRAASAAMGPHRLQIAGDEWADAPQSPSGHVAGGVYDGYVVERLTSGQIRPALRLPGADEYMQALDDEVRRALAGELSPAEALTEAAERWEGITETRGRQKQLSAWRESQGLRG